MKEINELLKKIEELRKEMNDTISTKGDLLDPEIIKISKILDGHLNEYHRLLKDKTK